MLANQLPPIPWEPNFSWGLSFENLALTLLSYYTEDQVDSRVILSFKRAFGMDQLFFVPPGTNNTPKAVIAVWNGSATLARRATLAIQGYTHITQLSNTFTNFATVDGLSGNLPGHVWSPAKTYADDFWARVFANVSTFATPFGLSAPGSNLAFTLTGFSLGAAIAEILAFKMKSKRFTTNIRLEKFGSPKVGTHAWRRGQDQRVYKISHYNDRDPVGLWPFMAASTQNIMLNGGFSFTAHYAADLIRQRYSFYDWTEFGEGDDTQRAAMQSELDYLIPFRSALSWDFHNSDRYLMHFLHGAAIQGGVNEHRFRWLEYPGRNNIGGSFDHARTIQFSDLTLNLDTPPDAFVNTLPGGEQRVVEARSVQPVIPQQSPVPEDNGPWDWGGRPALSQSLTVPRRRR